MREAVCRRARDAVLEKAVIIVCPDAARLHVWGAPENPLGVLGRGRLLFTWVP